jgi:hypothetical protein
MRAFVARRLDRRQRRGVGLLGRRRDGLITHSPPDVDLRIAAHGPAGFLQSQAVVGMVAAQMSDSYVKEQLLEIAKKWRTMAAFEEKHGR